MNKKRWKSGVSLMMAAALAFGGAAAAMPATMVQAGTREAATAYYIDAQNGNDANAGTSQSQAWKTFKNVEGLSLKAGEQVLLKAGCTWNSEKLMIQNAKGTAEAPVVLGKYGEGADPVINGNGSPWLDDALPVADRDKEDVAVVHVQNSEYITIQDLEVTNWENDAADLMGEARGDVIYDQSKSMLTGILVENHDAGEIKGIVVKDNYVHDVNGYMSQNRSEGHKKGSGGIMVLVTGGTKESFYTGLQITGNKVEKVCHEAIYMESCWAARTLVGGQDSQQAGKEKWVGWPDVYVAHNYVNNVAGDGIVLINADGGIAEYNLVTSSASEEWNYSRNPAHAAIWMWDCNNVTMQYNEAAYTTSTQDGMAFDCDYGNQNVMYQYNYSHDNKGGFWMACPGPFYTVNSVIRYNISVNDGLFNGSRIIRVGEKGSIGHQFYNNTIYWGSNGYKVNAVEQGSWGTPPSSGTDIYNNIFYGDTTQFTNNDGIHYDSNCVWGSGKNAYPVDEDRNAILENPGFVDVNNRTDGVFKDHKVTLGSADGLKLRQDSPCINAGANLMPVPQESLDAVKDELVPTQITLENKDYEGNTVPYASKEAANRRVDIGAFEYQGEGTYEGGSDATYLKALVAQASSYKPDKYTAASWEAMQAALADAQKALDDKSGKEAAAAIRLENALINLELLGSDDPGQPKDNILASYSDTNDNAGFESEGTNWGTWQSTVGVSNEQARTGEKSLKVEQESSGKTAYSEIGNVPVQTATDYVLEAWVYCGDADITKVGLEAKHHKNVTGNDDVKLANASFPADAETDAKGWKKATLNFTTQNWNMISISLSSDNPTVYMDDVLLYAKETGGSKVELDRRGLETAIAMEPARSESYYSVKSWNAYQDALMAARLKRVDVEGTQESLDAAAAALRTAYQSLAKASDKRALQSLYSQCAKKVKGDYTDDSWKNFQESLSKAKTVLENIHAAQADIDNARVALTGARNALAKAVLAEQKISVKSSYSKAYGDKAFSLNAKVTVGKGALSYTTSDKKVATVSSSGKVTIKGTGICTITVKAAAASGYSEATANVTLKVKPKKASLSNVKAVKGKKLSVKWKKDSKASGYQVQCSQKKTFKSGVKKVTVKKASQTSATIQKLAKGKKYYVRVRAYKTVKVNGKSTTLYGAWSNTKLSKKIK